MKFSIEHQNKMLHGRILSHVVKSQLAFLRSVGLPRQTLVDRLQIPLGNLRIESRFTHRLEPVKVSDR
jgi:hypothetical protein